MVEFQPFSCAVCAIEVNYEYFGKQPPYNSSIVFLEEGYFRRNPFSTDARPLFIGGHCSICKIAVCAAPTCSLFYAKRFCVPCASEHLNHFPKCIQRDIQRAFESRQTKVID
mmetsp:Transcript_4399/g.5920  ORF Transcript_4399/g.5920 Transcript_4399/m.5920 type:complete len:112 (-) Transcript_4399:175-510(-)